ncbi:MAG: ATP synthase subunit C [Candidatus Bathyarchaeia archaeon]|jgi:V/A-type H+-transporting ATPase subunit K
MKGRVIALFLLPLALLIPIGFAAAITVTTLQSTAATSTKGPYDTFGEAIGAGLSIGLSALGAGISISAAGSAAISALAEKPDTFFRSFLIVALAEALAIYGLIMGVLLWIKI